MKFKIKRILAVMLVFCMMMGVMPNMLMTAHAAENYLTKAPENITLAPGESKGVSVAFAHRVTGGADWGNANISGRENGLDRVINFGANAGTEVTPYTFVYDAEKAGTTETYWLMYTCTDADGNNFPSEKVSFTVTYLEEAPAPTTSVTVTKEWDVPEIFDLAYLPESVSVVLMADGESYGEPVTLNDENNWTCTWTELPVAKEDGKAIEYAVDEVEVPEGYEKTITDAEVPAGIGFTITNTLIEEEPEAPVTTSVTVVKEWNVPEGTVIPESVEVYLLANGQEVTDSRTVLDESNEWTYTWTELPVATEDGTPIVYTVDEVDVEGYEKTITDAEVPAGIGFTITNTLIEEEPEDPATTSVTVVKEWNVPEGTVLPDVIEVYLLANDQKVGDSNVRLTEDNDWTYTWEGLPAKDNDDIPIIYSVGEVEIEGYESTVGEAIETDTGIEIAITNTLIGEEPEVPETETVAGTKTWVGDEEADRPESIIVNLLANGEAIGEAEVTAETQWTFYFGELPKYNEDGAEIEYSVEEEAVEGYTATYDGYNITNTLEEPEVPETVTVAGTKTWVGDEEADRPERIIVNLLANGEAIGEVEVTAITQWTFSFGELPKYDESGAEIEYSVQEEEVEGYTVTYDGYNITNTLKEEEPENPTKPVYGIEVENGESYTGAGVETSAAEEGTKITIKADAAPEGKVFDKWVVNYGTITLADATKAETTFEMPAERVKVTANYKDAPVEDDDTDDNQPGDDENKPGDEDKKPSDDKKPTTDTESPKTGDTTNIFMWFALLLVSGFGLTAFLFTKKRRA